VRRTQKRAETGALLAGFLYDDRGNRMSPRYSIKNGVRYPFYVSAALLKGRRQEAGSIARASATETEKLVLKALRRHAEEVDNGSALAPQEIIQRLVQRINLRPGKIVIDLKETVSGSLPPVEVPWSPPKKNGFAEVSEPAEAHNPHAQQLRPEL